MSGALLGRDGAFFVAAFGALAAGRGFAVGVGVALGGALLWGSGALVIDAFGALGADRDCAFGIILTRRGAGEGGFATFTFDALIFFLTCCYLAIGIGVT